MRVRLTLTLSLTLTLTLPLTPTLTLTLPRKGDTRLGGMETGTALCRALAAALERAQP